MDTGELGIVALEVTTALQLENLVLAESLGRITRYSGWRELTAQTFEVLPAKPDQGGRGRRSPLLQPAAAVRVHPGRPRSTHPAAVSGLSPQPPPPSPADPSSATSSTPPQASPPSAPFAASGHPQVLAETLIEKTSGTGPSSVATKPSLF